ncbi:hypothetical protein VTN00DRAFT_4925 [Thermoascus crustaceus]|uniref:uncharacterized protein n=1 Tax=Thermoascus crustaceus TaxID=5088 RepID=UPI00374452D7
MPNILSRFRFSQAGAALSGLRGGSRRMQQLPYLEFLSAYFIMCLMPSRGLLDGVRGSELRLPHVRSAYGVWRKMAGEPYTSDEAGRKDESRRARIKVSRRYPDTISRSGCAQAAEEITSSPFSSSRYFAGVDITACEDGSLRFSRGGRRQRSGDKGVAVSGRLPCAPRRGKARGRQHEMG